MFVDEAASGGGGTVVVGGVVEVGAEYILLALVTGGRVDADV